MESRILYTARENKPARKFSKKRIWFLLIFLGLLAFLVGAVYLLRLPYWQIKKIEVVSPGVLTSQEVRAKIEDFLGGRLLFFLPRSSFFLFKANSLAAVLERDFPQIELLSFQKKFPDSLAAGVKERELFGIFCNEECVYIDKQGFAYDSAPNSSGSLLIKIKSDVAPAKIGSTVLDAGLMNEFLLISSGVGKASGVKVIAYEFSSKVSSEIKAETSEGFKIIFKRAGNFENSFRALKTVLEQEIKDKRLQLEYIDLRFGNKVFYRFKK